MLVKECFDHYLKGTITHGLYFKSNKQLDLVGFSDADQANCPDDRRSTNGYCVFFGTNLLSWISKKQSVVAQSSIESEYHALALFVAKFTWMHSLLRELGVELKFSPVIGATIKEQLHWQQILSIILKPSILRSTCILCETRFYKRHQRSALFPQQTRLLMPSPNLCQ